MLILSRIGIKSWRAAFLISVVLKLCAGVSFWRITIGETGFIGCGMEDVEMLGVLKVGSTGGLFGMVDSVVVGICSVIIGSVMDGAGVSTAGAVGTSGSGNGPTGSSRMPVSPSGIEEGAAIGSEKTGSMLVELVILSIAFCKSLSMFWLFVI